MRGLSAAAEPLRLRSGDGFELAAAHYPQVASTGERRGLVLIVPATGVALRLYDPLATFLAAEGFAALTWDWRGTGASRPRSLRGFRATMSDWATRDLTAALEWAAAHRGDRPVYAVAHSFGGQALGLAAAALAASPLGFADHTSDPATGLDAAVFVASQSGYWRHWPRPRRYRYAVLWYVLFPALTKLCGYFPGHRLGFGEDLPAGVALQWARWCRSPDYLGDWSGHARFTAPILALSFTDDAYAPWRAVAALLDHYDDAQIEHRDLSPQDVRTNRVGHFGFFKPGLPELWREITAWMVRPCPDEKRAAQFFRKGGP